MTRIKLAALVVVASALAACSGAPKGVVTTPVPVAGAATAEADAVFDLLMAGNEDAAAKRLKAIRKRDPMNPAAALLADSISRDPKELLGPASYPYTVRPGDTMVSLAERHLGNRLKAYQLLRYNGLKAPAVLTPGQTLRLPGEAPRPEPVRHPEPSARPAASPSTKPKPAAPKPTAPAAAPAINPAVARQVRAAGLAALNQGNVGRAVALLRRAATLDPGNPAIARDLARAERIAATVQSRK